MENIFDFHSISFTKDLDQSFDFKNETVKNIITNGLSDIISNPIFSQKLKKCKKLYKFLNKKRKSPLLSNEEIEEIYQNIKEINSGNIEVYDNNNLYSIHIKQKDDFSIIDLYKNPFLIKTIFDDSNKMDIDFISETTTMAQKIKDLSEYDFDLFYCKDNNLQIEKPLEDIYKIMPDTIIIPKQIEFDNNINNKLINESNEFNVRQFFLIMKSFVPKLEDKDLLYENIYPNNPNDSNLIQPEFITKFYFYYFTMNEELKKKYNYIRTTERINFENSLNDFILNNHTKNIRFYGGLKGIGKTTSLIYFSFQKNNRVFYINLEAYNKNKDENKLKDLLLQLNKLYGLFALKDLKNKKTKNIIENYIKKNYKSLEILQLISGIINQFIEFANSAKYFFCFIIDQISFSNPFGNREIYEIINSVENCIFIKLIICTTVNNDYTKNIIKKIFLNNMKYDFYYLQEFISQETIKQNILKDETEEIKYLMNDLGNSLYFYYELKKKRKIDDYLNYLNQNIDKNLEEYYKDNNTIEKYLELLDLVLGEKVICGSTLIKKINEIPIKYLKIKKFKIQLDKIQRLKTRNAHDIFIQYLYLFFYDSNNKEIDQIFTEYFDISEINNGELFIQNYLEKDFNSRNIFGDFFNDYIKRKKESTGNQIKELYVYKIDFSINFLESFVLSKIYKHLLSEYNIFLKIFNKSSIGNFFEILIHFYFIKKDGFSSIFGHKIEQISKIQTLVPQNYSIKNYSSKREKIKFHEFSILNNEDKKELQNKTTYLMQTIFNGKYYDSGFLLKTDKENIFDFAAEQSTIKKDKDKRFTKEEHELILGAVKKNLENNFNITIRKAYFFYILSVKDGEIEDKETKEDCEKNGIKYIGFDFQKNELIVNCQLEECFITDKFPEHNSVSLFEFNDIKNNIETQIVLNSIKYNEFSDINENIFFYLKCMFKNKYNNESVSKKQFKGKDLNNKKKDINNIKITSTNFACFLLKKNYKNCLNVFVKFCNKCFIYNEKEFKFKECKNISFTNAKELYIIYSKIPLDFLN